MSALFVSNNLYQSICLPKVSKFGSNNIKSFSSGLHIILRTGRFLGSISEKDIIHVKIQNPALKAPVREGWNVLTSYETLPDNLYSIKQTNKAQGRGGDG